MDMTRRKASLGQRWTEMRPTKAFTFWFGMGAAVFTMIVGFTWGGWVTGSTARSMAQGSGEAAVVSRLAPICLVQFEADPQKSEKMKGFKEVSAWQQGEYVKRQGWATMPGEDVADTKVAEACAKLL